jgi:membrane protease YdiL (CAAX protease family)
MDDSAPIDPPRLDGVLAAAFGDAQALASGREDPARVAPPEGDPGRSPEPGWPAWTAPLALLGGLVLAAVAGLVLDVPAALIFGVKLTSEHFPPGLSIADTVVQDVGFVLAALYCAHLGGRVVRSWQFGLRRPGAGWRSASKLIVLLLVAFVVLSVGWSAIFHPEEETLLKSLGSNEGDALLVLSAALTCVVAPICEEFLFRGFIFTALRSWRGTLPAALLTGLVFGGVHYGSAPALDLVPLAGLGFGLCLLYRYNGSLYPCIVAHSLNNSVAFASLEGWGWQAPVLIVSSLAAIGALVLLFKRIGLIEPSRGLPGAGPLGSPL